MEWLNSLTGGSLSPALLLVIVTLGLVLALILLVWVFRKLAGSNAIKTNRNRRPRLAVTDAAIVDDKRRLVLVRRDNVEHLVMIGGASDVVVETNIVRTQTAQAPGQQPTAMPEPAPEPAAAVETTPSAAPIAAAGVAAGGMIAAVSNAVSATTASANDVAAVAVDQVKTAASSAGEVASDAVTSATSSVAATTDSASDGVRTMINDAIEAATPEVASPSIEAPSVDVPDVEIDMNKSLEDALSADLAEQPVAPAVASTPAPAAPAPVAETKAESVEDEMQRLLSELSNEKA